MKPLQMLVYVCDEDGVCFQAKIVEGAGKKAEVQMGLIDNIDSLSTSAILILVAHALLAYAASAPEIAGSLEQALGAIYALLKARMTREKSERRHFGKRPARSKPSLDEDDSEIPF